MCEKHVRATRLDPPLGGHFRYFLDFFGVFLARFFGGWFGRASGIDLQWIVESFLKEFLKIVV